MSPTARPHRLGFLHIVPFDRARPAQGLAEGLELFRYAEELGFDSGWVRTRHMQYGLPSPAVFFGAVSQQTSRLQLGTAVIPVGFENPFRLAEDLGTADVLTGGRLQIGMSVHPPAYSDEVNDLVHDTGWREEDYGYDRIERLRRLLAGEHVREVPEYNGIGGDFDSPRVEPHRPGLASRLWYGGGSLRSAEWAGSAGYNWLVSNISSTDRDDGVIDFAGSQRRQIDRYRKAYAGRASAGAAGASAAPGAAPGTDVDGRVAVARVVVPTDGAIPDQLRKYREYVERRTPRTDLVHGEKTIIAKDIMGTTDEIVERIASDAAYQAADDFMFELPFELSLPDWRHILHQIATEVGPALGWKPGEESTR